MRPDWLIFLITIWTLLPLGSALAATLGLQTFKTHSRLVLDVDPTVQAIWRDTSKGFTYTLQGLDLTDLRMSDEALARLKDNRLKNISVTASAEGVVIQGEWNFPTGDRAPADPKMERFEYREKAPAKLLVDFWVKEGPTVAELRAHRVVSARTEAVKKAEISAKKRQEKRVKLEKVLQVQQDVSRFCQEPMKDGEDVFLPFHPFHETPEISRWLPDGDADEGFQYLMPAETSADYKYVKLAHELYQDEKYALAIRTIEFLEREQPKSEFMREMKFLKANALMKFGQTQPAMSLLQDVKETQSGHPTSLYAAIALMKEKRKSENHLGAIEEALWLTQNFPTHRLNWVFHLVAAESLYALRQTDRSVRSYEWIVENAPTPEGRALAAIRVGDAYLARFQYDRALTAYFRALERFPKESAASPSLQINRAESLYWLGQYDRALESFAEFSSKFSGHPAGWRSLIRQGEIIGRRSGSAAIAKSREHFLKTINHYPFSPGATLARLRLIPCGDHGGFTAETAQAFFEGEAKTYTGGGEVVADRYPDLRAMLRVRGTILLGDPVAAIDAAIEEKEGLSRKTGVARWIRDMERQLFRKSILSLLEKGEGFKAVQFYDKRITKVSLLDDEEDAERAVVDPDYLLSLSRVASDLGLGKMARKISTEYERANSAFIVARGIASPKDDGLETRLKASERAFTAGKALWVEKGQASAADIRTKLTQVIDESPFSFQREIILGQLDSAEGKNSSALKHALSARLLLAQGSPQEYTQDHAAVDHWIATLQIRAGQNQTAIVTLRKLQESRISNARFLSAQLRLPVVGTREDWILAEAELLEKSSRWGEAAVAYEKLVTDGKGGNRAQVQMAFALEKTGRPENISRSNQILKKVSESPAQDSGEDFWKELARKAIAGRENAKEGN